MSAKPSTPEPVKTHLHDSYGGTCLRLAAVAAPVGGFMASMDGFAWLIAGCIAGLVLIGLAQICDATVTSARLAVRRTDHLILLGRQQLEQLDKIAGRAPDPCSQERAGSPPTDVRI